jgi:hypothetical protein
MVEAARPVVPGRRVHQRAGHAGRHGRQQLLRLAQHRLRQHGAQRAGREAWLSDGALVDFGRFGTHAGAVRRAWRADAGQMARRSSHEIAARWPKVLRRVAGYNLDIFNNQSEKPYTPTAASTWRTCWSAPKARWPTRAA